MCEKTINVLQRLSNLLDVKRCLVILKAFILCHFTYCSLVWHFCGAKNTAKLEKLNIRGIRFVYQDFTTSAEKLLSDKNVSSLHTQRLRRLLIHVFKVIHSLAPNMLLDMYNVNQVRRSRNVMPLHVPRVLTTKFGLNSVRYLGCKLWNNLDNELKASDSFVQFKNGLLSWTGPTCKCSLCSYMPLSAANV